MPVRYGSWSLPTAAQIFSNRGVSGIDGCLSTAVGSALAQPEKIVIAVLGDVTTVYDSNALWTDLPSNLRVVVFNNSGGRIFDWIEGPNKFPELRKFIHTPRKFDFKHLSKFYGVEHQSLGVDHIDLSFQKILFAETATLVELICKDDN
jgi:2-succinyl-5-enolpyruvyl-6-hydroxy-3-cyclohexene-1-carboxylate synthase